MPCTGKAIAYARAEAERCVIEAGTYPVFSTPTHGEGVDESSGRDTNNGDENGYSYGNGNGNGNGRTGGRVRESDVDSSPIRRSRLTIRLSDLVLIVQLFSSVRKDLRNSRTTDVMACVQA